MRTFLQLAPVPYDETPEQLGPNYDAAKAKAECFVFRRQLERQSPPPGDAELVRARLVVKSNPHDFGDYYEVNAVFDDKNDEESNWAYELENNLPANWDDIAEAEIGQSKYQKGLEIVGKYK